MEEQRPPRILVVDDEGPLLHSLRRAVVARGFAVDTAADGQQAWERIRQQRYDLVVTDLHMPNMDGPELLRRIYARGIATRVVVITGHASLDAAVDCLRKGAMDFLVKPFEVETFLESVTRALERQLPPATGIEPDWEAVGRELRLTPRQREVLAAFYETGRSNRELAKDFSLSPHTIKSHLKVAFLRAGVNTRSQLLQKLRGFGP
ncbi:MAG: response regulator [Deferrisomatales bacterium]|nr:response regulator [Deferrisomatales bacterium]